MNLPKDRTAPALAIGAAIDFEMPRSLQGALQLALANHSSGAFVFTNGTISPEKSSYPELWNRALCMLRGLEASGYKTGDVLIIDAGNPATFIPALWAAILGGMVAVPLAFSRWNVRAHREFKDRLDKIHANLGQPLTLSDDGDLFWSKGRRLVSFHQLGEYAPAEGIASTDWADPAVLISTSGTTGQPQLVPLSGKALMHRWWPAGPSAPNQTRFLNWMPLDHVMGLGVAGPNGRLKIQLSPESFVQSPLGWLDLIQYHGITHAGMTNFGMKLIADAASASNWDLSSLQRVGVGTEMISAKVCARFIETLVRNGAPADAVILGYGLSECGPVAGGKRSFQPDSHKNSHEPPLIDLPTQGHAVRIVDHDGNLCQEGEVGLIEVCGPTMTSGYFGNPEADKLIFTDDGWFRTGDTGYLRGGCLCVTGREKEVILVNALKFSCAEIDSVIQSIPGVSLAHVFPWADGNGLIERPALVYATDGTNADPGTTESQIRKACADRFGFGLARCMHIKPEQLPRTRSGKVQRARLAEVFMRADMAHATPTEIKPPETLQDKIAALMASFLGGVTPNLSDDFFELGGDSLGALTFTVALERELKISLPPAIFTRAPTLRDVLAFVQAKPSRQSRLTIVPVQTGTSGKTLFIAPGVWGNTGYAHDLALDMGPEFSVLTFHITDPGDWKLRFRSILELAEECCTLMRTVQPQGPYHLAGHSFGGLVAFEMGRQLLDLGLAVGTLSIIDITAKLEQRDFAVDSQSHADYVIQHHRLLNKLYLPGLVEGPIRYFRARDSVYLPLSDKTGGWSYLSKQGVEVIDIPGDHQSIVKGPSLGLLSKHIVAGIRGDIGFLHPHLSISETARIAIDEARNACVEGNALLEIESLRRAIAAETDMPSWVFTRLAQALFSAGQNRAATEAYLMAIRRDPWPLTTHFRLREVLASDKLSDIALHALKFARQTRIDSPAIARITGTLCLMLGDVAGAERAFRLGLDQVPESLELRLQLLELLVGHGRFAEAEEQLFMALAYPIANDVAYQNLGMYALRLNRIDLATTCLQKSIAIDPGNASALALLGRIQATKGDIESAKNLESRLAKIQFEKKFRPE
jgi:acyl-CoA synthetase (AMP-forming)/AMP-acid ligase II/thioesterase domain-containing protein/acyl carrier protein/Flp pilus assembly protein TadD